jgi:hypothetical protein
MEEWWFRFSSVDRQVGYCERTVYAFAAIFENTRGFAYMNLIYSDLVYGRAYIVTLFCTFYELLVRFNDIRFTRAWRTITVPFSLLANHTR